tara:strand:- start:34515 stop:35654 length:1140 start_codon:yes stop_codon:yes gene_type:complete
VGVGYSTTGRRTGLNSRELAIQAAKAAMADAGMTPKDIDGVAVLWAVSGPAPPGVESVQALDIAQMMGFAPVGWYSDGAGPAYIGTALQAIAAIRAGFCHTCITFRVINQRLSSADLEQGQDETPAAGDSQFTMPFGQLLPLQAIAAMPMQRHMAVYGTTEEQFAHHAVTQRYHASLNEDAIFRDPLTVDDFLAMPYITSPLRILDCDYPVDSGSAVIYTTEERARDFQHKPVFVESAAYSGKGYMAFEIEDMLESAPFHTAKQLWERTDLEPKDVDCAQLYDGFSIITFQWLEALGFCAPGEAGPFIEAGNTRLGGKLPLNTDGGACNVGRRHGTNFCIESVRQIRGQCGARQVPDANTSVWANAVGPFSGAVLMVGD